MPRRRWEDNNKNNLKEVRWQIFDLIHSCRSRYKLLAVVNKAMNLRSALNAKHLLTTYELEAFQGLCSVVLLSYLITQIQVGLDEPGSYPGSYDIFLSFPQCLDRRWGPPSLLYNGYRVPSRSQSDRDVKLTAHIYLVPILRMSGSIPLLPL